MIYKPSYGRFKDIQVYWHCGMYYLFSMYTKGILTQGWDDEGFRNVWGATSTDGVHWQDIGPIIEDAPFPVWAMSIHRVGDRFIMNHGSYTRPGVQNVLRFWKSSDLRHWKYLGAEHDLGPDARWYPPESRLDCMCVVPVEDSGQTMYYGYATGPGGFLKSADGLQWEGMPMPQVIWDGVPMPPTDPEDGLFEIGSCARIGTDFYLLGGWFNYMGATGYGVYTLKSPSPAGPFTTDAGAYRLCGNSTRWVSLWARFCHTHQELLVNSYMYSGYSYETGEAWLPPLKKAVVDANGHLRLGYWLGNDALKGIPVPLDMQRLHLVQPKQATSDCRLSCWQDQATLWAEPERGSFCRQPLSTTLAILDQQLDCQHGVVIEGTIRMNCNYSRLNVPTFGLYLEETQDEGTAIMLHGYGQTQIGRFRLETLDFDVEDVIGPGCASVAGMSPRDTPHHFRLLLRKNMFELYLDDLLVQTFNTTHIPNRLLEPGGRIPGRLGFLVQNGHASIEHLQCWRMTL